MDKKTTRSSHSAQYCISDIRIQKFSSEGGWGGGLGPSILFESSGLIKETIISKVPEGVQHFPVGWSNFIPGEGGCKVMP